MNIVFLDSFTLTNLPGAFDSLKSRGEFTAFDRTPEDLVYERARSADILLTNKTILNAETLARLARLKFIAVTATGYNVVDIVAAGARGIPVSNVPEYGTSAVAQHTIALMLELANHVGAHDVSVHRGDWTNSADWSYTVAPLRELAGKTIGIIGLGRIGKRVGEIAKALGMEVLAYRRSSTSASDHSGFPAATLDEIAARCDVISLHCPLTEENRGMINASFLKKMRRDAFLINCSRGPLVIEQDLADALNAGTIAGAAVDVVSEEPIRKENPLLAAKNCIITPHIAWAANESKERLIRCTAENIERFIAGNPINVVNQAYLKSRG